MDSLKFLRGLVFAAFAFLVIDVVAEFFTPAAPESVQSWLQSEANGVLYDVLENGSMALQLALGALLFAFVGAYVASLVGLLYFKEWARMTYIAVAPLGLMLILVGGTSLATGLQSVIGTLTAMIDGAILALLFVDPIRARFRNAAATA